jgi:proliferating cell nuclear antigen
MQCNGDFADYSIEIAKKDEESMTNKMQTEGKTDCDVLVDQTSDEDLKIGIFSLKFINLFIKSSNLCSNVEILLRKDFPLILIYKVGSLGELRFVLAPEEDNEI